MVTVVGTYQNGQVKFDKDYLSDHPVKVIVTFLEKVHIQSEKGISLSDFSFLESQENLKNLKGSLSNTVVEERRLEV